MDASLAQIDASLHHVVERRVQEDASLIQLKTARVQEAKTLDQEDVTLHH
jgi:hypothetical protein